ncbi:heme NO-binding domain-containing protein [Ideonella paludis]|uniref:Heme NO-binding domain-containing protein n=2 Tax=Ideonella paludis TaxID=1233411 RepID=A0ABS5E115_9BURK|nr:heme NO-binding domain-containing protein [Ideonella paludis]
MLGMVFTEFLEMVEEGFGPDVADAILCDASPGHDGAYTAVGYYDHAELVAMVVALSGRTGIPVPDLVKAFGRHLLLRFTQVHPKMFQGAHSLFDLVARIDGHIHVEVHKLYSEATLPRFTVQDRSPERMTVLYQSPRGLHELAVGLLEGAAEHYGEACTVQTQAWQDDQGQTGTLITLERAAA